MDLAFGTNVREHFYSIGRLSGLETDRLTHTVRSILVSPHGTLDDAEKRPLASVPSDHFDGDIELRGFADAGAAAPDGAVTLTDATRLMQKGHEIGHLAGVEIDPATGQITAVVGRQHWWRPRLRLKAAALDFSVPGEIRVR
jgi:hypothetical protein